MPSNHSSHRPVRIRATACRLAAPNQLRYSRSVEPVLHLDVILTSSVTALVTQSRGPLGRGLVGMSCKLQNLHFFPSDP